MSDPMEQFLAQSQEAGAIESEGTFTVDFQKAREKLAKFQLADPHEFVLKIVQAANTSACSGIDVRMGAKVAFTLSGWPDHLTVEALAQRLSSGTLVAGDDPLDHLAVAVNAMLGLGCQEILLRQTLADGLRANTLKVGQTILLEDPEGTASHLPSQLVITLAERANLSKSIVKAMLEQRCLYSTVPITVNEHPLHVTLPETSGAHRAQYFRSNQLLAHHRYGAYDEPEVTERPDQAYREKKLPSARAAHLRMTVDLDPMATIWLGKSGVLAQMVKLPLGVPGLIGVIAADDLATDLTGFQFMENDKYAELVEWLQAAGRILHQDALHAAARITAESQPVRAGAPINEGHGCLGCGMAFVGWCLSFEAWENWWYPKTWPLFCALAFWLAFPILWSWWRARQSGAEVDRNSDAKARSFLMDALRQPTRT